jgi:hypothetical protein
VAADPPRVPAVAAVVGLRWVAVVAVVAAWRVAAADAAVDPAFFET